MQKRHNIGTALVENCIIIGLVALTSIGILTTFGGTIHEVLANCNFKFKEFQPFGKSVNAVTNDEIEDQGDDVIVPNEEGVTPGLSRPVGVLPTDPGVVPMTDGIVDIPPGGVDVGVDPVVTDPIIISPVVPVDPGVDSSLNTPSGGQI